MKSSEIGAFEAKTRLSELLEKVRQGRTFVITRRGQPVAELRPVRVADLTRFSFGCDRGRVVVSEDFDAPLPDFADLVE
jgi:prevent-host-death family protein